ncbi:hypothetical protein [Faucicola boevrei]|uniref:hypothetical protein n=1 Tax=Faucicola boevrei TaxID=346665 RepID=UPI000373D350|nr:hypothetical protein [Moraxella boevrei]
MSDLEILFKKIDEYQIDSLEATFGKLDGLFVHHFDWFKINIFDVFCEKMDKKSLQDKALRLFLLKKEIELPYILSDKRNEYFNKPSIDNLNKELKIKNFNDLVDFFVSQMNLSTIIRDDFLNRNRDYKYNDIKDYYPMLQILKIFYQERISIMSKTDILNMKSNNRLIEIYGNIGIDIKNDLKNNYGLLAFDSRHMSIRCDKDNQNLIDCRVVEKFEKFFSVLFGKRLLLECLNHLFNVEKIIKNLYFRIDGISDNYSLSLEEFDFGAKLKMDIDNLPKISRLYDLDNPKDNFWIFHDNQGQQISFEELYDDFELFNDDVVTQLVHLEYEKTGNEYFITHIDHEYIIYNFDEYENRLLDNTQKGYKKVKTFKVDNAKIPFFYQYEHHQNCYESGNQIAVKDYFLFIVLDSFFKHKELLKEYFENVNKEQKKMITQSLHFKITGQDAQRFAYLQT